MEARLVLYPLSSLAALLLYQGTNPGLYYLIGLGVYFWAYSEGEVSRYFESFGESVVADAYYSRLCVPTLGHYRGEATDRDVRYDCVKPTWSFEGFSSIAIRAFGCSHDIGWHCSCAGLEPPTENIRDDEVHSTVNITRDCL